GPEGAQRCPETLAALELLENALASEFDVTVRGPPRPRIPEQDLRQRVTWLQKSRARYIKRLKAGLAEQTSGRIHKLWIARVALTDPSIPATTLEQFCTDFPEKETQSIGKDRIGAVRDAMAATLKKMAASAVARHLTALGVGFQDESKTVFLSHIHDEASMRLRSYDASLPGRPVQGNCVTVVFPGARLDLPTELQPLGRKTGAALAKCMVDVVSGVLGLLKEQTVLSWSCFRFVHLLTGDGTNANQNAARRLLRFCQEHVRWGDFRVRYRLVVLQCASHAANLVVIVAICGDLVHNAVENNDICANCSRLYKHLIPDYVEEFPRR
ncbi:unnamed protein product, partial [Prorocentrum cordatum]